jgi:serine protease AprX
MTTPDDGSTTKTAALMPQTRHVRIAKRAGRGVGLLSVALLSVPMMTTHHSSPKASVLVRAQSSAAAADAVRSHGGTVTDELEVIGGVVANVDGDRVGELAADPVVSGVDLDTAGDLQAVLPGTTYDTESEVGSMYETARLVGADKLWARGATGSGVGVALIDSGVQPSAFFGTRLVAGADFTGANNSLADGYGHGTHMAGIIAGSSGTVGSTTGFTGIAPRATIFSVRVADNTGATSLMRILQGLDWVYKNHVALNIKVVNMSVGVPAYSDYTRDPIVAAAQRLWYAEVTVVASAGNIGPGLNLTSPAIDPTIIAVGAVDTKATLATTDDGPASFSAGAATANDRSPTVVVPARSIQSIKATGSVMASIAPPASLVGTTFMRGTGTSQAAAIVSGEAALMYSATTGLGPTDVKMNLCNFASNRGWDRKRQGCGVATVAAMTSANIDTSYTWEAYPEASVSATTANATTDLQTRAVSWQGSSWQGSSWQGSSWQGASWQGSSWQGQAG